MGASGRRTKEPIFSPYNEGADCVLSKVIVDVDVAIVGVANELVPIIVEAAQCCAESWPAIHART
jgi:hypothetical protein